VELHYEQILCMENVNRHQWLIFWLTCVTVAAVLLIRLGPLLPLYTNADLRSRTQALIQGTAQREGWILSGLSIRKISGDNLQVLYRSYLRGRDPVECFGISLTSGQLSVCDDF
jgi:hypothetical protein